MPLVAILYAAPPSIFQETAHIISFLGESLSIATSNGRKWVIVTPLSFPGETIRARVYRHSRLHSHADLLEVLNPNPEWRDSSRVQCQYFGKCAGCQYQVRSLLQPQIRVNRRKNGRHWRRDELVERLARGLRAAIPMGFHDTLGERGRGLAAAVRGNRRGEGGTSGRCRGGGGGVRGAEVR